MENTNEKQKSSGKGAVICGIIIGAVAAVMMIWMTVVLSGINNKLDIQNQRLTEQNQTLVQQNNALEQQATALKQDQKIIVENRKIAQISFKQVNSSNNNEYIVTYVESNYYVTIYQNGYVLLTYKESDGRYTELYYIPPECVLTIDLH